MWIYLATTSLFLLCKVCAINGAAIYDAGSINQNFQEGLNEPLETPLPRVPSPHIIDDAFSSLNKWRNSDDLSKQKILSSFLKEIPVLTNGYAINQYPLSKRHPNFGFMGSRGKRTQDDIGASDFLNTIRPGFRRALETLRSQQMQGLSPELSNSKRQPAFGFHAVRG
ncbi:hypothetical protein LOTGIDRAFT_173630 [Lottia gigantea]|uniref:Uncharacterized protein n=1 Tax=Lottia gigantea TaxID=225164 RepID=V4AR13_LOTGI|nr:hypothetical protein LOTGIDRAFT_173630 [Lottia gigantea]ESO99687.1 hypothetical protein LOTGIDRAFT_173630 [Lottia gigantea]